MLNEQDEFDCLNELKNSDNPDKTKEHLIEFYSNRARAYYKTFYDYQNLPDSFSKDLTTKWFNERSQAIQWDIDNITQDITDMCEYVKNQRFKSATKFIERTW